MEGNGQRPNTARPVGVQPASDSADQMRVLQAEVEALRAEVARLRAEGSPRDGNQRSARALERVAASASHVVRFWRSRAWYRPPGHVLAGGQRTVRTDEPAAPVLVHWWWEWPFGLLILFIAAFLRFSDLSILPSGLHGDEAITGLEGQRILREGWIGPYSPQALGQPSGPLYATAAAVAWLGHTVFAVRVVPALMGTITVAALFVLLRLSVGSRAALIGAALLAVMNWHVHFSRIGFPLASWPLVVLLAAIGLVEATKRGQTRW
ncbi:MAG: glycosyltransferase family 39 protein, partial [Chloroflexota bacterium]|nr:glycosyltransferase family 39 protein [Chloroflexota bacterium]